MPEEVILNEPGHQSKSGTNLYRIKSLNFVWLDNAMQVAPKWTADLVGENGTLISYTEGNAVQAEADIKALNKANLSTKSLQRRLFEVLIARGALPAGSISGLPD